MAVKNKVQLITYADSLGGDLKALKRVLDKHFKDKFKGGIHILPPFPSSGDRGFAPLTYFEIEPKFGTWNDINELTKEYDILLDLMVNHISKNSPIFQDFVKCGKDSKYVDFFLTLDKVLDEDKLLDQYISKMFLRRTTPYSKFNIGKNADEVTVWTTFGKETPSEQIDIDVNSQLVKQFISDILTNFSKNNIKIVRLDAVGYVIKKMGTSCFCVEPEIYGFLNWITELAKSLDIELLPEVHAQYRTQFKLADNGNWIYDFVLPYLILSTLVNKSNNDLYKYLKIRSSKQFTMLDCHDGIPIKPDLDDLVSSKDAKKIVDMCVERGSSLSLIHSDAHKSPDGFDVHQIRCSYYSALDCNDDAYLAARAIQFFTPGIPQVYYVGLLAGKNDIERVNITGEGREINRHNFSEDEIEKECGKEVVQRLLKLIDFRNNYDGFNGKFVIEPVEESKIKLTWKNIKENVVTSKCTLTIDLDTYKSTIYYVVGEEEVVYEI